jgi:hypothetical protein
MSKTAQPASCGSHSLSPEMIRDGEALSPSQWKLRMTILRANKATRQPRDQTRSTARSSSCWCFWVAERTVSQNVCFQEREETEEAEGKGSTSIVESRCPPLRALWVSWDGRGIANQDRGGGKNVPEAEGLEVCTPERGSCRVPIH